MLIDDFDFDLPERLIATRPARPRSSARLLVAGPGGIEDRRVTDLPGLLRPGDRLVLNDTRVLPARLVGTRQRTGPAGATEARIEVTLIARREQRDEAGRRALARRVEQ
jgi:S-adenosylmethionine:tRNA ribosyltransferase-isomerase